MKIPIDINSFKNSFLGANSRQYLFYVQFNFPNFGNALKEGLSTGFAGGVPKTVESLKDAAQSGGMAVATAMVDISTISKVGYYVKSTNLPSSDIEPISSYWCGQEYKMASLRKFEDWTVTLNIDHKADVLKSFWSWQKIMHDPESNIYGKPTVYMADQEVHLLGMNSGETICVYKLYGAWPKTIGQVSLDYSSNDFANVDITFTYQYHTIRESQEGTLANIAKRAGRGYMSQL